MRPASGGRWSYSAPAALVGDVGDSEVGNGGVGMGEGILVTVGVVRGVVGTGPDGVGTGLGGLVGSSAGVTW